MTDQPDVSVVMSVYNNTDTLAAAMDSILAQEGVAFEFIVIDDGSTDACPAMLDDYARRDARVRVVHQENAGLTRALIRGCEMARAPWIARQDADDLSLRGRLRGLLDFAGHHPAAGLLASAVRYIGPRGEELCILSGPDNPEQARRDLLDARTGPPAHGSVMFSREVYRMVGGYRACFYYGQDSDLWMRMAEVAPVSFTGEVYYCYRLHPGAISGGRRGVQKKFGRLGQACCRARRAGRDESALLQQAESLTASLRIGRKKPGSRWHYARSCYFIGALMEDNHPAAAQDYFRQAIRNHPLYLRAWIKALRAGRNG